MTRRSRIGLALALLAHVGCGPAVPPADQPGHAHGHGDGHAHGQGHGQGHGGALVHEFKDAARWAKDFDDPARDAWQKPAEVVTLLAIAPGMTVADLGAGTGYFLPYLSRAVGESGSVLALDVEPDMVAYMRDRAARERLDNTRPTQVSPGDPGLAPASVDRVLVVDTWHHIPEREAYSAKLRAALRPCGFVAVVDFTLETQRGPPRAHRIAPERAVAELAAGGLRAEIAAESLPDQYVVLGRAPGDCAR